MTATLAPAEVLEKSARRPLDFGSPGKILAGFLAAIMTAAVLLAEKGKSIWNKAYSRLIGYSKIGL
jgi:hypothetical protein